MVEIAYDITYMWNLNYDTNKFIYKTETHIHIKQIYGYHSGKGMTEE